MGITFPVPKNHLTSICLYIFILKLLKTRLMPWTNIEVYAYVYFYIICFPFHFFFKVFYQDAVSKFILRRDFHKCLEGFYHFPK